MTTDRSNAVLRFAASLILMCGIVFVSMSLSYDRLKHFTGALLVKLFESESDFELKDFFSVIV